MRTIAVAAGFAALCAGCAAPPDPIPQLMQDAPRTEEDVRRAIAEIRKELGESYVIDTVEGVFYMAANGGLEEYKMCRATVERMVRFLYRDYLGRKPAKPIRIYCFKDAASYESYCRRTYDRPPSTPFGFYMPAERKMVMNIATGTGTLAHEIAHPLVAEDFPEVPSWFNEGFASLYEQSRQSVEGRMEGLVNWRLKGLKEALKEDRAVTLADLVRTSSDEFYAEARGVHYATARYLCKWLPDHQKLQAFYRDFRDGVRDDPTGRTALEKALGAKLEDFDGPFRAWITGLK